MRKPKKVNVVSATAEKSCPKCGYCDRCGRSNQLQVPLYWAPYISQPWYPFWAGPTIGVGFGTTSSTFSSSRGQLGASGSLGDGTAAQFSGGQAGLTA